LDKDAARLRELGYEQELDRNLGGLENVALGFATISPVVGLYAVAVVGTVVAGPAWIWVLPLALGGQCLLLVVYSELRPSSRRRVSPTSGAAACSAAPTDGSAAGWRSAPTPLPTPPSATADAAQPRVGSYAGKTTQPATMPYSGPIKLKVVKRAGSYKLAKVTVRMKMDCQGDPPRVETFSVGVPIDAGKVSGSGRFSYSASTSPTSGFTIKGRFVSRTKATGTFGRSDADTGCYVGNVKWTATLR
jgi:hypothetical protein